MTWSFRLRARATVHLALVTAGVVTMMAAGGAQQQGQAPPAGGGRGNFADNFTGKIAVMDSAEMRSSRIRFEAGARTRWHLHSTAQLLLVEDGKGLLQEQGSAVREILAGQPVLTKPGVLHWHGAARDQHAVQFSVYSGTLDWKDQVSDDEYLGKTKK
jgi:quercetin dioxygenase-like cupin family protein